MILLATLQLPKSAEKMMDIVEKESSFFLDLVLSD